MSWTLRVIEQVFMWLPERPDSPVAARDNLALVNDGRRPQLNLSSDPARSSIFPACLRGPHPLRPRRQEGALNPDDDANRPSLGTLSALVLRCARSEGYAAFTRLHTL